MSLGTSRQVNAQNNTIEDTDHQWIVVIDVFSNVLVLMLSLPPLFSICVIKALQSVDNAILFTTLLCGILTGIWHLPMSIIANYQGTNELILEKKVPCLLFHVSKISSMNLYVTFVLVMSFHNGIVIFSFLWYEQNFTYKVITIIITVILLLDSVNIGWLCLSMEFDPTVENLVYRCNFKRNFSKELRYYHRLNNVIQLAAVFFLNIFLFCFTYSKNRAVRRNSDHIETAFVLRYDLVRDTSATHILFCCFWIPTTVVMFFEDIIDKEVAPIVCDITRILRNLSLIYYPLAYCIRRELLNRSFALVVTTRCCRWRQKLHNLSSATLQNNMEFLIRRKGIRVSLLSQTGPKSSLPRSQTGPKSSLPRSESAAAPPSIRTGASDYNRKYDFPKILVDEDETMSTYLEPTTFKVKKIKRGKMAGVSDIPKRKMSGISESVMFNPEKVVRNQNPSAKSCFLNYGF